MVEKMELVETTLSHEIEYNLSLGSGSLNDFFCG